MLCDQQSEGYRSYVIDALVSHAETNEVAIAFDQYIRQAIDRTCTKVKVNACKRPKGPKWYDRELGLKRSDAIKAGENMNIGKDNDDLLVCCRENRSLKQRKEREYKRKCLQSIEHAYGNKKSSMLSVLNAIDREKKW